MYLANYALLRILLVVYLLLFLLFPLFASLFPLHPPDGNQRTGRAPKKWVSLRVPPGGTTRRAQPRRHGGLRA